jgi:ariadne-1
MDSDAEMPPSDEEMVDDEDYYDYYSDMGEDDDGGIGGDSDGEMGAGDYEGIEAEGSDVVMSRREQVRRRTDAVIGVVPV